MNVAAPAPPRKLAPVEIQEFIAFEAQLLNERRFEEWLSLFTGDAIYWVPARHGQESGETEASLAYDDMRLLTARIERLRHPRVYSQIPPAEAVRLVSNIAVESAPFEAGMVHSSFIMLEHRLREQRVFGGAYEHELRRDAAGLKIAKKVVRLINCADPFGNLGVPF